MGYKDSKTPENEKDSWATPYFIFNWANDIYDFDVDLAASKENSKVSDFFSIEDDALSTNWAYSEYANYRENEYQVGWCNPPYSNIGPWVTKAIQEGRKGFTTVMLIPTPNGERYFSNIFRFASRITFIEGRLSFIGSDGTTKSGSPRGSCLVVFDKYSSMSCDGFPRIDYVYRDTLKSFYGDI